MIRAYSVGNDPAFFLGNDTLSCIIRIHFSQAELLHFGAPLLPEDAEALSYKLGTGWGCSLLYDNDDQTSSLDALPLAWSASGTGDYRESPIELLTEGTPIAPDFVYRSFAVLDEPPAYACALPSAKGACETLELTFTSASSLLGGETTLSLYFSLYETALVRRTVFRNNSGRPVQVRKLMSSMLDLKGCFDMTAFSGAWIDEMHPHRVQVTRSRVVNESTTGFSSNFTNPGFLLSRADTNEDAGEAYGFNLIWSGNHYSSAQLSEQGLTRVMQGISDNQLLLQVEDGACLETPEAVLCYSDRGFNGLSEKMHRFVNSHIIPECWRYRERPVIYNDWEGCMFDFNEAKLLSLAKKAKKLGCELFVLD
ncbi:MAG: alpha-galactosidase, partial [Oscillospiraceae bacterium]|nr:alpha-galactosidase [Oscillospiraceae bacterium]